VEIRHENGGMWTEGWVRYGTRDSHPLSAAAIGGYGGEELYVYSGVAITPQKQGVAQR
jgi:UTP:GlnB (protein PII) uridylyltransferase